MKLNRWEALTGSQMPLDVQELLQATVLEAEEVVKGEVSARLFKETMAALSAAIEQGRTSIELLKEIDRQVVRHDQAYNEGSYDSYGQDDVDALLNVVYEVMDVIDGGSFESVGMVEQYIADMNNAYGKMKQSAIDFSAASKDEPLDVTVLLENPSFQQEDEEGNVVFNCLFAGRWRFPTTRKGLRPMTPCSSSSITFRLISIRACIA